MDNIRPPAEARAYAPPQPFVEPTRRRVRVRLGRRVVADSTRAQLLIRYPPDGLPTYFIPQEDVRPGALIETAAGTWSVEAAGRLVADAAWASDLPELDGHVTFSWETLDWYEEDERVYEHARDPHHRVDAMRSSRHIEVFIDGEQVADSVRPVLLFETTLPTRHYLPAEDVRSELFMASETISRCPYKGLARYLSHPQLPDAAWSYPEPIPELPKIRDLICFYDERVDTVIDGVAVDRPHSPFS